MAFTLHTLESLSQNPDELQATLAQLTQFRQQLYASFPSHADAIMDLLDALCSNTTAQSVVELSLNPLFRHSYNSVYDGIQHLFQPSCAETAAEERRAHEQQLMQQIAAHVPALQQQRFWLLGVDVTPAPRRFAHTLADRTYVYQPNAVASNKPVTIGHQYSALVLFPEKTQATSPSWVVPLSLRRVLSQETKRSVGAEQMQALLNNETLPFHQQLWLRVVYFVNHCAGVGQ